MGRKYGRVLMVNLGDRTSETKEIDPGVLKRFIGGPGLSAYLYSQLIKTDIPALDPASPFFFMTGPLLLV
jgi:aldehyde:ferredoxin oxidoreductase